MTHYAYYHFGVRTHGDECHLSNARLLCFFWQLACRHLGPVGRALQDLVQLAITDAAGLSNISVHAFTVPAALQPSSKMYL